MRKVMLCIAVVVSALSLKSQTVYLPNGTSGIGTSSNGNVGIGITDPIDKLQIHGAFASTGLYEGKGIYFSTTNGSTNWGIAQITPYIVSNNGLADGYPGGLEFKTKNPGISTSLPTTKMVIDANGNVGIGTTSPQSKLVIANGIHGISINSDVVSGIGFNRNVPDGTIYNPNISAWQLTSRDERFSIEGYNGAYSNLLNILKNGSVGIGTTAPDQKLTVNGKIHAQEVIVDLNVPLADYVFAKDYELMPLHQVDRYVQENSHLPEMPSATEVKEQGMGMGEMQNKLLKKVEELTLYLIQQDKRIKALEEENQRLKK